MTNTAKSNKKLLGALISAIVIIALSLCLFSCGSDHANADGRDYLESAPSMGSSNGSTAGSSPDGGIGSVPSGTNDPSGKIIKTADANVSTEAYDDFLSFLYEKINEYGGYTDHETFRSQGKLRYAQITVRVPADKLEDMKNALGKQGTLTFYSAKKNDVSLTYATLEAEVETLTLEVGVVEELFEIAKSKGDLSHISNLESRLTDLKLRIADAQAQLSVYDNKIAFSTLNLSVSEVESEKDIALPEEKNAFERIGENLGENLKDIGNFFVEFFVWFVSALPYLIIFGIIGTAAVFIVIRIKRREANVHKDDSDDVDPQI